MWEGGPLFLLPMRYYSLLGFTTYLNAWRRRYSAFCPGCLIRKTIQEEACLTLWVPVLWKDEIVESGPCHYLPLTFPIWMGCQQVPGSCLPACHACALPLCAYLLPSSAFCHWSYLLDDMPTTTFSSSVFAPSRTPILTIHTAPQNACHHLPVLPHAAVTSSWIRVLTPAHTLCQIIWIFLFFC